MGVVVPIPTLPLVAARMDWPETYRVVEVALVVVELTAVKSWRVEEPVRSRLIKVPRPEVKLPIVAVLARNSVVEARLET